MKIFVIALLLCAGPLLPRLQGQPPGGGGLTLPAALARVSAANPELASARSRLGLLEAEELSAGARPNPRLEAELGSGAYEAKLSQPVPLTRAAATAGAAARAATGAARLELEALETRLLGAARKAWYALRIARERRGFEETHLNSSMDILGKIELRLQTGEAGNADLARAKVEVSRGRLHAQEAAAAEGAAAGELNSLMGRRPEAPLQVSPESGFSLSPEPAEPEPLEAYTALALARRAELRALELALKSSELTLKLEKSRRLPVPEVGLVRGRADGASYSRLFLGLELPLWYANRGEIRRALALQSALAGEQLRLELEIRREVYSAWLELGLARSRLASARETVFLLNDLRRAASQDYLSGKTDLTAFYETNRVFLEENINYLDALKDYYERTAQMEAAVNSREAK